MGGDFGSRRLLASGIGIVSPLLAVDAAHALRELLQDTSVSEDALQKLFAKHGIRVQTARFDARILARRFLRILELSFHCVATLPRELPRTLDSAADVTELLASLGIGIGIGICARSIARRVSNPGRNITRLLRPERLWCGCSYRRLFLAASAIMVSGFLRRGARDPHAREWFGSCSRYRRRLERGRRTSWGVMLGYRVSTSTCRLLAPLLYAGLDALVTYFLRHFRPSQFCAEPH